MKTSMRTRGAVALALAGALALAACGGDEADEPVLANVCVDDSDAAGQAEDSATPGGDAAADGAASVTVDDTEFGPIDIEIPADGEMRVVALGWSDAEMALALGVEPVGVIDWQGFGAENNGVGPWAADEFTEEPTLIDLVEFEPNREQVANLEPDLILSTRSAVSQELYDDLSRVAPMVYAPEGTPAYGTPWEAQIRQVGQALDRQSEAEDLIVQTCEAIVAAGEEHPELQGLSVVAAAKFGDAYAAYLPGDGRLDLMLELGMESHTDVEGLADEGFFAEVPAERANVFEADIAVFLPIGFSVEDVENDDLLQSLDVVRDGRSVTYAEDSEVAQALSAASVLSIPVVLDQLVPDLAAAADNVS